jgi:hypothetical protein
MNWETKNNSCDSLYCCDLELNLHYLRGMPVHYTAVGGNTIHLMLQQTHLYSVVKQTLQ